MGVEVEIVCLESPLRWLLRVRAYATAAGQLRNHENEPGLASFGCGLPRQTFSVR